MGKPLIRRPQIGDEYVYVPKSRFGSHRIPVRVIGFRRSFIITEGVKDARRRDIPISLLETRDE